MEMQQSAGAADADDLAHIVGRKKWRRFLVLPPRSDLHAYA
jgi:hypothetical protein